MITTSQLSRRASSRLIWLPAKRGDVRPTLMRPAQQTVAGTLLAFLTTQAASTLAASILQTSASPLQRRPSTSRLYKPPFGCTRHSAQTAFQPQSPGASSLEPLPCPEPRRCNLRTSGSTPRLETPNQSSLTPVRAGCTLPRSSVAAASR